MLKVSTSGYYNWLKSKASKLWLYNQKLSVLITTIFNDSFKSYDAPRIKTTLEKLGHHIFIPKVARLMKANGLFAIRTRKFKTTKVSNHNYPIAPNILNQNFKASRVNQVWVSDITYLETKQGWMYLNVIIDLFNKKVVGWYMSDNLTARDTIIAAWNMAAKSTVIAEELIFHYVPMAIGRESQYASDAIMDIIKSHEGLVIQYEQKG